MSIAGTARFRTTVVAVAGLSIAAIATGAAVLSGPDSPASRVTPFAPSPANAADGLVSFDDCDALARWYARQALPDVTAWGLGSGVYPLMLEDAALTFRETAATPDAAVSNNATGTNVQEAGVDEPDTAKTMGDHVVAIRFDELLVTDVSADEPVVIARLQLPKAFESYELLVVDDRVVVIGTSWSGWYDDVMVRSTYGYGAATSALVTIDLSDPAAPTVLRKRYFDGEIAAAREHDGTVRVVSTSSVVDLPFIQPGRSTTHHEALQYNRALVREAPAEAWLPHLLTAGKEPAGPMVGCADVRHPRAGSGLGTITVLTFDPHDPGTVERTAITADGSLVYSSTDRLYVSTVDAGWNGWVEGEARDDRGVNRGITTVHAFDVSDASTSYVASGDVEGVAPDRWAFDEHEGQLRVATTRTRDGWQSIDTAVSVLQEEAGRLEVIGQVDGLGETEEIKSVRWFDDLAVLVTFRQTDPLYAIDLSDPARPRVLGELKIPGFSEYLHPIGDDLLLGIGQSATMRGRTTGAQASIFDLNTVQRVDHLRLDGRYSPVEYDPRAFTYLPDDRLAFVPVAGRAVHGVSVLRVDRSGAVTQVDLLELTGWLDDVRTLPLDDGRIAVLQRGKVVVVTDPAP